MRAPGLALFPHPALYQSPAKGEQAHYVSALTEHPKPVFQKHLPEIPRQPLLSSGRQLPPPTSADSSLPRRGAEPACKLLWHPPPVPPIGQSKQRGAYPNSRLCGDSVKGPAQSAVLCLKGKEGTGGVSLKRVENVCQGLKNYFWKHASPESPPSSGRFPTPCNSLDCEGGSPRGEA